MDIFDLPEEPLDQSHLHITYGATVAKIGHHPVYGTIYYCRGWMAHHPWDLGRKDTVTAWRGETFSAPKVGSAHIAKLRKEGSEVNKVYIGQSEDEPDFELILSRDIPIQIGDILTFSSSDSPTAE
jgi:hypothetical protein